MSPWKQTKWTDEELQALIAKQRTLVSLCEERAEFFGDAILTILRAELRTFERLNGQREDGQ